MGKNFDPVQKRGLLLHPRIGYEWSLESSFEKMKDAHALGSVASSDVCDAIYCLLVGLDEPAIRLLKKALEWVTAAIEVSERPKVYFPGGTESSRYETLALCSWLLFERHDSESLVKFVEFDRKYVNSQKRQYKPEVCLRIVGYLDAGAYERILEIFEMTPGLSPPKASPPRNEAQMAYVLARHHLGIEYTREDVEVSTRKFLRRNIDSWLADGLSERAARWLKVLHWNDTDRSMSAKQVILNAYAYLPGRTPPSSSAE